MQDTDEFKRSKDMHITVDIDPNSLLILEQAAAAGEFVFDPHAENLIIVLLQLQKMVNTAVDQAKAAIEEKGLENSKYFTSVTGDLLKATYQAAGHTYKADTDKIQRYNPMFFERKITYKIDTAAVKRYEMKHHGKLPANITRVDRKKNIVLRPSKELGL